MPKWCKQQEPKTKSHGECNTPRSNVESSQQMQTRNQVLSPGAKSALRDAIFCAIRNNGVIDPVLLNHAVALGLPRQAVLNAAYVAREIERIER
jgi:hypothetical protein